MGKWREALSVRAYLPCTVAFFSSPLGRTTHRVCSLSSGFTCSSISREPVGLFSSHPSADIELEVRPQDFISFSRKHQINLFF